MGISMLGNNLWQNCLHVTSSERSGHTSLDIRAALSHYFSTSIEGTSSSPFVQSSPTPTSPPVINPIFAVRPGLDTMTSPGEFLNNLI